MADKVKIFITSRVADEVPEALGGRKSLREVRREIADRLRRAFDGHGLQILINEDEPAETDIGTIERCERWAKQAHLVLALINGHPGTPTPRGIGICYLELKTAADDSPSKILLIKIATSDTDRNFSRHPEFKAYFEELWSTWNKFGATPKTAEEIIEKSVQSVAHAVARMASISLMEWRRGRGVEGEAFEWATKTYSERSELLVSRLVAAMEELKGGDVEISVAKGTSDTPPVLIEFHFPKTRLIGTLTGVPDSFGVPDARKYCGYPFRDDSSHLSQTKNARVLGPIHLVAVYKRITASQIRSHIGNPDIAIIKQPFGYFCKDQSQAIQVVYLVDIADSTVARVRVHELIEWLSQEAFLSEVKHLAKKRWRMCRT